MSTEIKSWDKCIYIMNYPNTGMIQDAHHFVSLPDLGHHPNDRVTKNLQITNEPLGPNQRHMLKHLQTSQNQEAMSSPVQAPEMQVGKNPTIVKVVQPPSKHLGGEGGRSSRKLPALADAWALAPLVRALSQLQIQCISKTNFNSRTYVSWCFYVLCSSPLPQTHPQKKL